MWVLHIDDDEFLVNHTIPLIEVLKQHPQEKRLFFCWRHVGTREYYSLQGEELDIEKYRYLWQRTRKMNTVNVGQESPLSSWLTTTRQESIGNNSSNTMVRNFWCTVHIHIIVTHLNIYILWQMWTKHERTTLLDQRHISPDGSVCGIGRVDTTHVSTSKI